MIISLKKILKKIDNSYKIKIKKIQQNKKNMKLCLYSIKQNKFLKK